MAYYIIYYMHGQTVNRLIKLLKRENEHFQIKVDTFLSSEGVEGLGDQPFVCYSIKLIMTF